MTKNTASGADLRGKHLTVAPRVQAKDLFTLDTSIMFVGKIGAYYKGEHMKLAPLWQALALLCITTQSNVY